MAAFKPMKTSDENTSLLKVLLYAFPGWGKTTQAKHYQSHFGPGFIISGEAGLSSIRSAHIDYLPFSSWDGEEDHANGVYSFRGICRLMTTPEFKAAGYKWIMIDSLTELSDHCLREIEAEYAAKDSKNNFAIWGDYANALIGACKWVRDLPYHVVVTALAKEDTDDNGSVHYWPMVQGKAVQKQLPGIFDCVFAGVRTTSGGRGAATGAHVQRFIVTDEVRGWHGKVRDERRRLKPVERVSDVTELFRIMDMSDEDFAAYRAAIKEEEEE